MHGLEMVRKSDGKLKLGAIYITLSRLEEKGWATARRIVEPRLGITRKVYKITGAGAGTYRAWTGARDVFNTKLLET